VRCIKGECVESAIDADACAWCGALLRVCILLLLNRERQLGHSRCRIGGRPLCADATESEHTTYDACRHSRFLTQALLTAASPHALFHRPRAVPHLHVSCGICHHCPDCDFGEAGWRVILQALATAPHIPAKVVGLKQDFVSASDFDPSAVLRDLKWPVDLLQQPDPDAAIPQFCRELHKGAHSGDPVASLLLLGPGGAGKSTLLHRLTKGEFNTGIKSTDGLRIGA